MSATKKPHFHYFPRAYDVDGVFEAPGRTCEVCERSEFPIYRASIYTAGHPPNVCAVCIANGRLGQHLDHANFALHDAMFFDADTGNALIKFDIEDENEDLTRIPSGPAFIEVMQRTPGFPTWNAIGWPVKNGKPMAFLGHGNELIVTLVPGVKQAITAAWRERVGKDFRGPDDPALVFTCFATRTFHALIDTT